MDDKMLKRFINSAGGWFVGEYAAVMMDKYYELENDKNFKKDFIHNVFHSQGRDKDYGGTRTRVNALLRIIKSKKIIEALEYIIGSDRIQKDDPKAVEMAKKALKEIESM